MFSEVFIDWIKKYTSDTAQMNLLWSDIAAHHSDPKRHYHNLSHLDHLEKELFKVKSSIADWDIIVCSIAYHDIVYDISRSDNEERSAEYATAKLFTFLAPAQIQKCSETILATKGHQFNKDADINLFTDADISILGSSPERYVEYTEQIRREYQPFPDMVYKPGRKRVLEHFLNMEKIFKTPFFFDLYEKQARSNIEIELQSLNI